MPSQSSEQRADGLAEALCLSDMVIARAWAAGSPRTWSVRIESRLDAEHDTYFTAHGATFTDALAAAVEWCGEWLR